MEMNIFKRSKKRAEKAYEENRKAIDRCKEILKEYEESIKKDEEKKSEKT